MPSPDPGETHLGGFSCGDLMEGTSKRASEGQSIFLQEAIGGGGWVAAGGASPSPSSTTCPLLEWRIWSFTRCLEFKGFLGCSKGGSWLSSRESKDSMRA